MKVRIKQTHKFDAIMFGGWDGAKFITTITPDQIWNAKKDGKYWYLNRRGCGFVLRVTEGCLKHQFQQVD